jgi:hypothetical protein
MTNSFARASFVRERRRWVNRKGRLTVKGCMLQKGWQDATPNNKGP